MFICYCKLGSPGRLKHALSQNTGKLLQYSRYVETKQTEKRHAMSNTRQTPEIPAAPMQESRAWFDAHTAGLSEPAQKLLQTALSLAETHYPADAATPAGEPLLAHLLGAARMVNELDLLPDAVAATLLADIVRFVPDWRELLTERCNSTVAELVKGVDEVQKLTHFARVDSLATPEERAQQAETMRIIFQTAFDISQSKGRLKNYSCQPPK